MDASNTTLTVIHLCIAWTLFGALLVWILLFAFLALRPEAKKEVEIVETYSTSLTGTTHMTVTQPPTPSLVPQVHIYETANEVAHSV